MRDFPPVIDTFYARGGGEPSAAPDTRTRARFLLWMLKLQWPVILTTTALGMFWQLPPMFGPFIFGRAVDEGILPGDVDATLKWGALLLAVTLIGAVFGILMHTYIVRTWLIALYGTMKLVTRKAAQMGHVLPRRTPTGEVLSVASADSDEFGALTEILARTCTQLVAYLVVAFIVLSTSVELGVLLLIAAPVLVGAAFPLLKPLHRRQEVERGRNSDLTSLATDIVAGLRILRGIGGERTFGSNYAAQSQLARQAGQSAGIWQAGIEAVGVLFSGVFVVLLVWLGTRQVIERRADHRRADQLPRLRAVHDLPDPDVLRVRPEAHPGDRLGAQGDRDLRAAAAVDRRDRPAGPARARRPGRRGDRLRGPRGSADDRGQRRARGHLRAGRPAGPLPLHRRRADQPGHRRRGQGPRRPACPGRARGRACPDRGPRRGARPPAGGA